MLYHAYHTSIGTAPCLVSGLVWSGLVWSGLVWSGLVWDKSSRVQVEPRPQTPLDLHDFKARPSVFGFRHTSNRDRLFPSKYTHEPTCSGRLEIAAYRRPGSN